MARMEIDLSEASHNEQHNNQIKLRRYCKRCKINIAASETVFRDIYSETSTDEGENAFETQIN